METESIIIVSVLSAAWLALLILVVVLFMQVRNLRRRLAEMQPAGAGRIRVQKLTMDNDKNHAFHNPALAPDEELSRRGYSMYMGEDAEMARPAAATERQTGGQFVEELAKELDHRQQRQAAPPFLLQSIQETRKNMNAAKPTSNATNQAANPIINPDHHVGNHAGNYAGNHTGNHGRQSVTNPNFIY